MTAAERIADQPHPLLRGATPATVNDWLMAEDRPLFCREYEAVFDRARAGEATRADVDEVVERWRQLAVLQSDQAAFRRTVRRLAEVATGVEPPEDEPLHITREKAGV